MKKYLLLFLITAFSLPLTAQEHQLKLKSGTVFLNTELDLKLKNEINYCFLSFRTMPNSQEKAKIEGYGIQFLEYIPSNTFVVSIPKNTSIAKLDAYGVSSISLIKAAQKLNPNIQNNIFPKWIMKNGKISIKVLLYKNAEILITEELFESLGFKIIDINLFSNSIIIEIDPSILMTIADINDVWYIEPVDPPSIKENKSARTLHRSNTINTNYMGGRYYNGEGINIMMQDDGLVGPHIDREGRVDQSFCIGCSSSSSNDHGDHVSGTIMGAGNLNPLGKGMADGSFLYVFSSSNNNYYDVPMIYQNNDVTITSKSYSNGCNAGYTSLARDLDEQINLYPSLTHVFSAGNDGSSDCGYGAGSGWGNVTGGHKQAKNVIATANLTEFGGLANSSSRGPAADGRIKPDIGAKGTSVYSPVSPYTYDTYTGTSMACPGIAGTMAQLYHGYKELNGNVNPSSALMKGVLLNSADDIGNPGPDFKHGWGEVNAYQAIKILENNQYQNDSIDQGGSNTHIISIPAGVKQCNIMVYWHDKEASANAAIALVNDIDIGLYDTQSSLIALPWVLDPTANTTALNSNAILGNDHLNNMEQITFNNPIAGNYVLSVDGFSIPFGFQEYWVVYQYITDDIKLTYPIGGESFVPGETELLRWDASYGNTPFTLEYTTDGGMIWNTITTSTGVNSGYYNWTVPNIITSEAKIRVSRNGFVDESDSNLTIIGVPQNVTVNWVCPDSIYVLWNAVPGATEYEVSMLGNMYMDSILTTSSTMGLIINPNPAIVDSWFSVCAKVNTKKGRRAVAVNSQPTNISCVAPPIAGFSVNGGVSCSGTVSFTDISFNQPSNWFWDFGDGNTSILQNPTHTYLQQGTYDVSLFVSNALGQDSVLETSVVTINFFAPPIAYNDTSYVNPAVFSLISASADVQWYSDTLGSSPIFFGTPFTTPLLSVNTTYYLRENSGNSVFGGVLDTNIGNGDYYNGSNYLIFDSYVECELVSADVYAQQANTITFELRDNSGFILEDTTITVSAGKQTLGFNFDVPIATGLQLGLNSSNAGLYRNNSGAVYPYTISNLVSFTGGSNNSNQDNWYSYYNIEFKENCISQFGNATAVFIGSQSIEENIQTINIFPNPAILECTIAADSRIKQIRVFDISARLCMLKDLNRKTAVLDLHEFSKGIYTIDVITDKDSFKKKLIIK